MNRIYRTLLVLMVTVCVMAETPAVSPMDVKLADLQGQPHSLAEYRGRILVVNFWATWCGPCKHEMPLFVDAEKKYGDERVQVIAVSLDDASTQGKIPGFAEKEKMAFPILLGDMDTLKKLGLGEGLPATAFVDRDGRMVARVLGEISKSELKQRVEWLLNGEKGQAPAEVVNNLNKKRADDVSVPMMH